MFLKGLSKMKAPELPRGLTWLNSDPKTMKRLQGKVVLIDFWTFSCVNCIRTLPHLVEWQEKYAEHGLEIIGVHTPEFAFEKDEKSVKHAMKKFGVNYANVLDPDYKIWRLYANRWWPRKFLVDHKGSIVYDHVGEGGYAETEHDIQKALHAIGGEDLPAIEPDMSSGGGICYRTTPETYLGFLRGRFGNAVNMMPKGEQVYTDDEEEHDDDMVYLHGHWELHGEFLAHTRKVASLNEYILLRYSAFSVNLVMRSRDKKPARVYVELDGQPLPEDMAGEDVKYEKGKAYVQVDEPRMYRLVDSDAYHKGVLKLKTATDNIEMYAFTFGGCKNM